MARAGQTCLFILILLNFTACGVTMAETKFDWKATESAPKYFPMEIIKGDFHAPDGYSLYVPNKKLISDGWGSGVSSHLVGPDLKSLPDRLKITFYSYVDDKFYHGDFELPYDEILRLFQQGYYSPKEETRTTYFEIIAGVAPGGQVTVWLGGIDSTKEVFTGQAQETKLEWTKITENTDLTRKEYRDEMIEYSRKEMDERERNMLNQKGVPTGLWSGYRKQFQWEPTFTGQKPPELIDLIKYYNGEEGYLLYPLEVDNQNKTRPVPKELHFVWALTDDKKRLFEVYFDEEEIFEAFEKLAKGNEPLKLRMHTEDTEKGPGFWPVLENGQDRIVLRKTRVEFYGV